MDFRNITQFYVILANFHKLLLFNVFYFIAISLFRCIVHKNDTKLKYNLKHQKILTAQSPQSHVTFDRGHVPCYHVQKPTLGHCYIDGDHHVGISDG